VYMRALGRSEIDVSALGVGTWAIGGPVTNEFGAPVGWGEVNDAESVRAIRHALDLGITFFDTANVYGTGHSETLLGQALDERRSDVVIATKFGRVFEEGSRQVTGNDASPAVIRQSCEDSLRRLNTDYIDLYQFHLGDYDPARAVEVRATLEDLVREGKILWYGWSTDDPARARVFAEGPRCTAVQFRLNIFERNEAMLALCREHDLAAVIRGPLAMGLLTGKFTPESALPDNDVRSAWDFKNGDQARWLERLAALQEVLTRYGHTLAQAALGWLWAYADATVPIPGFKTASQVEENVGAMDFGPLGPDQMREIEALLAGSAAR
jgi:aryl-alcohol dehydrogenase-like predicted oxidoreductase